MSELLDVTGVYGAALDYAVIIFLVGSAFMLFCYLASIGKLGFDEDAKYHLFQGEGEETHE